MEARRTLLLIMLTAAPLLAQSLRTHPAGVVLTPASEVPSGGERLSPAAAASSKPLHCKHRRNHGGAEVLPASVATLHDADGMSALAGRLVELPAGASLLTVADEGNGPVRVSFLDTLVTIHQPGEYRFDTTQRRLIVIAGSAGVSLGASHITVATGHSLSLNGDPTLEELRLRRLVF